MLDFGFSEILLTSAIALVVLGPERLPKVARQVGNWMGRARAMARQLSEQLEREVSAEELMRQQTKPNTVQTPPPAIAPLAPRETITPPETIAPSETTAPPQTISPAMADTPPPQAMSPATAAPTPAAVSAPAEIAPPYAPHAAEPQQAGQGYHPAYPSHTGAHPTAAADASKPPNE
jgi:sec-independent protein translocase protein TatB